MRKSPEEMRADITSIGYELKQAAKGLERDATSAFAGAPSPKNRAEFARWLEEQPPHLREALTDLGNGKAPRWYRYLSEQ